MKYNPWTHTDEQTLIIYYQEYSNKQLSEMLGRTVGAVKTRARELGLKKTGERVIPPEPVKIKRQPKRKFKSYYEPISINAIRENYGINV